MNGTTTTRSIPVDRKLVGLRLHARRGPGGVPTAPEARALVDLDARNRQQEADAQSLRELLWQVAAQVDAVPGVVGKRLDEVGSIAVELGLSIAREIVGAALDQGIVDPSPTVMRCLADCVHGSDRADLVVRLHPADLDPVQQRVASLPELREQAAAARFVADANVPRGGVRAETGAGRLRYDPREVLERICAEVRREAGA